MSNEMTCPRCQCTTTPVEVHGHTQCRVCKLVVEECCQGETCENGFVDANIKDEPTGTVRTMRPENVMSEATKDDKQPQ